MKHSIMTIVDDNLTPAMSAERGHGEGDDGGAPLTSRQIANVISLFLHALAKAYPMERPHFEEVLDRYSAFLRGGERLYASGPLVWWVSLLAGILGGFEGWCGRDDLIAAIGIARKDLARPEAQA